MSNQPRQPFPDWVLKIIAAAIMAGAIVSIIKSC